MCMYICMCVYIYICIYAYYSSSSYSSSSYYYFVDGFPRSFDNLAGWDQVLGGKASV